MYFPSIFANTLLSQIPFFSTPSEPLSSLTKPSIYDSSSCPSNTPLSCHNSTSYPDSCCFIHPGGQLLQTQFWDTNPTVGPDDSWTLHGLWPDLCDGSYPTYCTSAPRYYNISTLIGNKNQDLLDDMEKYWLPNAGTLEHFWEHEWNKHGTCVNTLAPSCYGDDYEAGDEVVDFFGRTVELFKGLDTYKALAAADILPSSTKTYDLEEITNALKNVTGFEAIVGCRGNRLDQAWYSFNVRGSLQGGTFEAVEAVGKGLRCPRRGIRYLPK